MTEKARPWQKVQKFYQVYDIRQAKLFYGTSTEAYVHCGVSATQFRRCMATAKKSFPHLVANRYIVREIPKYLFVLKTKRVTDVELTYALV